ncbi:MAG TPA: SDR family oxidoreductase [Verrucomicrobiae bacterium]|mgnify:CR=1 FL=1|nr:SDR family oxidoreductase [Verrucomicrobiae bacterium]
MGDDRPVALVTGAGRPRGLGAAIARALADDGYRLVVHFHKSGDDAAALAAEVGGIAVGADLSTGAAADALIGSVARGFGRLDVLINNAGVYHRKDLRDISEAEWREGLDSTASACFFTTRAALPLIRLSPCGRVVNIGDSSCEKLAPRDLSVSYHIGKIGVLVLTRSFARQEAEHGVTVNMVSPGILENSVDLDVAPDIPAGRRGTFGDVLGAIRFLLRPDSGYVNGSNLVVSGGWNL